MLVAVGTVLVLLTFRDYGVTWDEDVHNWYGNFVLDYYLSLFGDQRALHWRDLYNYGASSTWWRRRSTEFRRSGSTKPGIF